MIKESLMLLKECCKLGIISSKGLNFLKICLLRGDERILFTLKRYFEKKITFIAFCGLLNESIILSESKNFFNCIYCNCTLEDAKKLSRSERTEKNLKSTSLTYGEIEFDAFYQILCKLPKKNINNNIFYDLGSGSGRAVIAAALTNDYKKIIGIEILTNLHNIATKVLDDFNKNEIKDLLHTATTNGQINKTDIQLLEGSIIDYDWSDGDVIFANSTCFDSELMDLITKKAIQLKPGTFIITFTKELHMEKYPSYFELLEKIKYKMSWGPATVYFHRRLDYDNDNELDQWKKIAMNL